MTPISIEDLAAACRIEPGTPARLDARPTRGEIFFPDAKAMKATRAEDRKAIAALQTRLFAEDSRALLVVLQGMDAAGKSGVIKSVFRDVSPFGMAITAFGPPSKAELARDFLWRIHAAIPRAGRIGVFDRSHYEDVLVARVRNLAPVDEIERRYGQINDFERHLTGGGTHILKIMLHMSHETQAKRLKARAEHPHKRWKLAASDLDDHADWHAFMDAYAIALKRCSTPHAPWHVIPADQKGRRNALAARLVRGALETMAPEFP